MIIQKLMELIDILFICVSSIVILGAYLVKKKTLYIIFQVLGNAVLIVNYLYLGSLSSILVVAVATVRFIVFYLLVKKYDDIHWGMIFFFSLLAGVLGAITAENAIDYIFVVAVMLYTVCYKVKSLMMMKIVLLVPLVMMLTYSILMQAYSGMITHGVEIALILAQTAWYLISKNKEGRLSGKGRGE